MKQLHALLRYASYPLALGLLVLSAIYFQTVVVFFVALAIAIMTARVYPPLPLFIAIGSLPVMIGLMSLAKSGNAWEKLLHESAAFILFMILFGGYSVLIARVRPAAHEISNQRSNPIPVAPPRQPHAASPESTRQHQSVHQSLPGKRPISGQALRTLKRPHTPTPVQKSKHFTDLANRPPLTHPRRQPVAPDNFVDLSKAPSKSAKKRPTRKIVSG